LRPAGQMAVLMVFCESRRRHKTADSCRPQQTNTIQQNICCCLCISSDSCGLSVGMVRRDGTD
jgi:hypothetical protein